MTSSGSRSASCKPATASPPHSSATPSPPSVKGTPSGSSSEELNEFFSQKRDLPPIHQWGGSCSTAEPTSNHQTVTAGLGFAEQVKLICDYSYVPRYGVYEDQESQSESRTVQAHHSFPYVHHIVLRQPRRASH